MNGLKISLAEVLAILAALSFGFICFLGSNFYTQGDIKQSIFTAAIIAILLIILALGLKKLKQVSRNFRTFFVFEMITLFLLTAVFSICTWFVFSHYFVVSEKKTEIQSTLTASINQAQGMFPAYESYVENRLNLYNSSLTKVINSKNIAPQQFKDFDFVDGVSNNIQINKKLDDLRMLLLPTHYSDTLSNNGLKEVANKWLADANNKVNNWKPIGVVNITNDIERNAQGWLDTLINYSKERQTNEITDDFTYDLYLNSVKQHFTTQEKPTLISLGLAILGYLLMLLPWIITKRHTRFPGFKLLFGNGKSTLNEL